MLNKETDFNDNSSIFKEQKDDLTIAYKLEDKYLSKSKYIQEYFEKMIKDSSLHKYISINREQELNLINLFKS